MTIRKQKTPQTQRAKLAVAFLGGFDFTTEQIASRLNVSNSRARYLITELRRTGYAIYTNRKKFKNGNVSSVYRLGMPSRKMVAAAAKYGPSNLFIQNTLITE